MNAFRKPALFLIGALLSLVLLSCGGGGGGGGGGGINPPPGGGGEPPAETVLTGAVVDGFVAGATVRAYRVNADGTKGDQIGTSVITDNLGNYSLNLGTYTGLVYLESMGGSYVDAATGITISLTASPMILSAIVPNASGNVNAEINPLTTMAANVALYSASQENDVATAATGANGSISNYFGLLSNILDTALLDLTKAGCMSGASQQSANVSAIVSGISQLAETHGVSPPDLIQALVGDVTHDGVFDGLDSGAPIFVALLSGGTMALSAIEGAALTGLADAITLFMNDTTSSNVCGATVDEGVISALSYTNVFSTPLAPEGVEAASKYAAAIVSWNTVTLATSYNLYMAKESGVSPTSTNLLGFRSIKNVTSPSVISSGMSSGEYFFVVTAVSGTTPYTGYESDPSAEASTTVTANAQWAKTVAGTGILGSQFNSVSAAPDRSVYAAGTIAGSIDGPLTYAFGSGVTATTAYSGNNATLVKYDDYGVAQWARTVTTGTNQSSFESVAVAPNGSAVCAAGYITGTGTYNFGGISSSVTATVVGASAVLVKYDSAGFAQWARTVTGSNVSQFNSVAVASDGSVYAAGYIASGTYDFGDNVTVTGINTYLNIVLVKYSSSGVALWAQTVTAGNFYSDFYGVCVAPDGSVYAAGFITGPDTYNFGTVGTPVTTVANSQGNNIILVKYSSSGTAQWARSLTFGSNESVFYSLSVAADGSVYTAGYITGTGTFDFGNNKTVTGALTGDNPVLVKYDNITGLAQWAKTVTAGGSNSYFYGAAAAPDGSAYAGGYIGTGTYNFGNGVAAAGTSSTSLVLVKYDGSTGLAEWAQTVAGGNGDSLFNGVSVAPDNTVYGAGGIWGSAFYNFGNDVIAAGAYTSSSNSVLVKYNGFGSIEVGW